MAANYEFDDYILNQEAPELAAQFTGEEEVRRRGRWPVRSLSPRRSPARRRPQRARRPALWLAQWPAGSANLDAPDSSAAGEYVRWVQTMLNQVLGLQLPVDGVMSVQVRSAIRSFQAKNGLPVTGIVGPDTEKAFLGSQPGPDVGASAPRSEPPEAGESVVTRAASELYFLPGMVPDEPTPSVDFEDGSELASLSPTEAKAARITSTFETGRTGGFGGLTGNIDGQGLSFGLLNFSFRAGSLPPLLQEFITKHPARFAAAFEKDAERFKAIVFATKPDPSHPKRRVRDVARQMDFVNNQMNKYPKKAEHNKIVPFWSTYFSRLENDPEFRKIQIKAVRRAAKRARYWFDYFGFKTERGFVFMFDLVSSHGGAWLDAPKFKGKRKALLRSMLAAKQAQTGQAALSERQKMEVIANMIADVSLPERRKRVRERKLWFVKGRGKVQSTEWDIKKNFGVTDAAPNFGTAASSSEYEWELNVHNAESEFEVLGAATAPPLLGPPEKAAGGVTIYAKIGLGKDLPAATGIYIPDHFRPDTNVTIVVYLHGYKSYYPGSWALIMDYWNGTCVPCFALREEVVASGKNIILVAPSLGVTSEAGSLIQRGGFDAYMDQVLAAVNAYYLQPRSSKPLSGVPSIILAAHSGGGAPMLKMAAGSDRCANNVKECWSFDAMYGAAAEDWLIWAKAHPQRKLYAYFGQASGYTNKQKKYVASPKENAHAIACAARRENITNVCMQPSRATAQGRIEAHFWVPKVHIGERLLNRPCLAGDICPPKRRRVHPELEVTAGDTVDWPAVRDKAVMLAKQEYERWDRGRRHETNPKFGPVLTSYWVDGARLSPKGASRAIARRTAWSAAFISWLMRKAGAGKSFRYSSGHYAYVSAAKRNRLSKKAANPFWAYRVTEAKPEVGDLICNRRCDSRQPARCGATFDNVDNGTEWSLHCDIVVDVKADHILVIGGNTSDQFGGLNSNTVGMKKVLLDENGRVRTGPKSSYIAIVKFRTDPGASQ